MVREAFLTLAKTMKTFRYIGVGQSGQTVTGVINAANRKSALESIRLLEIKKQFRSKQVDSEKIFVFKAERQSERPFYGEQRAFERSEVEAALRKLGYRVCYVRRKLFSLKVKPSYKEIVVFIRICADLLRDNLPYDEILKLLHMDTENKYMKQVLSEIRSDLKEGKEGKEVFEKHKKLFGEFPAYMLGIASTSGDMAAVYDSTARFLERNEEFKKNLRQALIMPGVIMVFMAAAVIFYVVYIFPKTTELFVQFNIEIPPMTSAAMAVSDFLKNNIIVILASGIAAMAGFARIFKSRTGRYYFDKYLIRVFYIGPLLHKTSIEIFARVFHVLYSDSGDNIQVIRIAAKACRNKFMESQIISIAIPLMVKEGQGLIESLEATGVFTKTSLSRFRSGAESGALKSASLQLANYYEKETSYKLRGFIDWVNVAVSIVIVLIVIGLTVVSSETAVMRPKMPGLNY